MTQQEVYINLADGNIHAKIVPDASADKYELYKTIRRLSVETRDGTKFVKNYFFCVKCGSVKFFNTQTHYNELVCHYNNECSPQLIGRGNQFQVLIYYP